MHPCPMEKVRIERIESETLRLQFDDSISFGCPECGAKRQPANCPSCGHHDLQFTLSGSQQPVAVCQDCGTAYDQPPMQE